MEAVFSVRAKYQAFYQKEKMSYHSIYVNEVAKTSSFYLETLLILLKAELQGSMEGGHQPGKGDICYNV